jgi:hypothetical protein
LEVLERESLEIADVERNEILRIEAYKFSGVRVRRGVNRERVLFLSASSSIP